MEQEKYTFIDVCQQDFDGIEIPIIQRDYAQGREKEEKKRNRFLEALLKAINSDKGITLDFIYGSVIDKKLVPLDGQQRLTTLFLLHWYAAKRENIPAEQQKVLEKFSYATRPSARRFCEQLLVFIPDFNTEKSLSEQICNEAWFPMAWNDDPTVEGMLRMLDAIHHTFAGTIHLWKALTEDRKITFYFKKLEDMDITDDIYIKMNSRGKPLTDFEHFKAEFTEAIRETIGNDTISHKIDVAWTNMLWPYRSSNNIIDEEFLNYFHFLTDIIRIKSDDDMGNNKDYFEMIPFYKGNNNNVTFLEKAFDLWEGVNIDEVFNAYLSGEDYETGKVKVYDKQTNLFKDCCKNYTGVGTRGSFGFNKMLILYAFIVWKTKATNITDSDFARRIRIVRNLVWNSEIRLERMKNLLEEVEEIVINASLTEEPNGFNIRQKREEIEKIAWCDQNPNLTEKLFELEDHWTLCGCIAAVGLDNPENFDSFRALFDNDLLLVSKTLLTYGDYSQTYTDKRYHFIASHNYRTWQEMLQPSQQRKEFEKTKDTIALLLGSLKSLSAADLEKQIQTYLKDANTLKDWRYYSIKYSSILSYAQNGMYYQEEEWQQHYNIEVLRKNSFRGFHWNAILIAIYEETEENELVKDDWGSPFTLKNGMTLENTNETLIFRDNDKIVHTEKIPQTSEGIDLIDRVEKALELIRTYQQDRIDH